MKHFSHPHDLHIIQVPSENKQRKCFGCKLPLFGSCYTCSSCNFYLHKFCFELPQAAQFESHPKHTLGLLYPPYIQGGCEACGEPCNGFTYNCSLCNFNLHANCASLLETEHKNDRERYIAMFLRHKVSEQKKSTAELGSMKAQNQHNEDEQARIRQMEIESDLQRRRHNLYMQQLKQTSDSIDFMGQIGTSNYTYRY
ncbi:Cysteine/Histidine-rich C1 domain family protein [Abeliophyllum distichum]|uniref:Cysteine/Histidine-rich C1 domain family protein n=1 Tax=Abeliophyllum distichum TaxID=126358 RepID=A0ABD1PBP0_9LAMI